LLGDNILSLLCLRLIWMSDMFHDFGIEFKDQIHEQTKSDFMDILDAKDDNELISKLITVFPLDGTYKTTFNIIDYESGAGEVNVYATILNYIITNIINFLKGKDIGGSISLRRFFTNYGNVHRIKMGLIQENPPLENFAKFCLRLIGIENLVLNKLKYLVLNIGKKDISGITFSNIIQDEEDTYDKDTLNWYTYISSADDTNIKLREQQFIEYKDQKEHRMTNVKKTIKELVISIDAISKSEHAGIVYSTVEQVNAKSNSYYYTTPANLVDGATDNSGILNNSSKCNFPADIIFNIILKWGNKEIIKCEYIPDGINKYTNNFQYKFILNKFFSIDNHYNQNSAPDFRNENGKIVLSFIKNIALKQKSNNKSSKQIVYTLLQKTMMDTMKPVFLRFIYNENKGKDLNYISLTIDQIQSYITSIFAPGTSILIGVSLRGTLNQNYGIQILTNPSYFEFFYDHLLKRKQLKAQDKAKAQAQAQVQVQVQVQAQAQVQKDNLIMNAFKSIFYSPKDTEDTADSSKRQRTLPKSLQFGKVKLNNIMKYLRSL
jgi:hypothetical protein